jgi:ribosomal-protein-alanine N-acetyltransferase
MLKVRTFRAGDLRRILEIEQACFGEDPWPADLFRSYAAEMPEMFLVAKAGVRTVGYCLSCVIGDRAYLDSIAVDPAYRGRGAAKLLLRECIERSRAARLRSISLVVRKNNVSAIGLYRSFGFVRTRTVRGYYRDGGDAWRMRVWLS